MIQRIQTLFLLGASLLLFLMFILPLASVSTGDGLQVEMIYRGFVFDESAGKEDVFNFALAVLLLINLLISFLSIFLFKKRILQIRLSVMNILLLIGLVVLMYFSLNKFTAEWEAIIQYKIAMAFPLVAAILSYLAIRAIGKDEALIRSMNRIR